MTGILKINSTNVLGKSNTENMGGIVVDNLLSGDSDTRIAFARQIDTFARAVNYLSTNTYNDSIVDISRSINDIIAEETAGGE